MAVSVGTTWAEYGGAAAASHTTAAITSVATDKTIVVAVMLASFTAPTSVTDSKGNTYTQRASFVDGGGYACRMYVAENVSVGAGHTITVTPASSVDCTILASCFAGTATSAYVASTGAGLDDGADPREVTTGAAVPSGGMAVSATMTLFGGVPGFSAGNGFSIIAQRNLGALPPGGALFVKAGTGSAETGTISHSGSASYMTIVGLAQESAAGASIGAAVWMD